MEEARSNKARKRDKSQDATGAQRGENALLVAAPPQQHYAYARPWMMQVLQQYLYAQQQAMNATIHQHQVGQYLTSLLAQQAPTHMQGVPPAQVLHEAPNHDQINPFQLIGEDVHRHILSYLMCPSKGWFPRARSAQVLYMKAECAAAQASNPSQGAESIVRILKNQFARLSPAEKAKWNQLAKEDLALHVAQQQDSSFVTPDRLLETCQNLSLVSKYWRTMASDIMNLQAPAEIISPRDLFLLKCRALSLSLSSVGEEFSKEIERRWGEETFPRLDDDGYPDEEDEPVWATWLLKDGFGDYPFKDFNNLVASEYSKFLLVKSVETIVATKHFAHETPTVQVWKEKCKPNKLIEAFWVSHMLSPDKYAKDCHSLIGDMVDSTDEAYPFNSIISNVTGSSGYSGRSPPEASYTSKRDLLFQFENQIPRTGAFIGRFGGYDDVAGALFGDSFDIRSVTMKLYEQKYNPRW